MNLAEATFQRIAERSLDNAARNRGRIGRSVAELPHYERAIVVGNGPSLVDALDALRDVATSVPIVATDGALRRLLPLYPSLVVTCDPHPRIAHWFGAPADGHFQRTGEAHADGPIRLHALPVAIATASAPETVDACERGGASLYWWNAMLDDPTVEGSLTRTLYEDNGLPCLNGGGNVGTAAWVLAHQVLGAKTIALVGFDFGYPPDFPVELTQYWPEIQALYGDRWPEAFTHYANGWYADPAFAWFRETFYAMRKNATCETVTLDELLRG